MSIYEVQQDDIHFSSSFSINNKLAFALEDTAIEKLNVDNHIIPVYVSSTPMNLTTDMSNKATSHAIISATHTSYDSALLLDYTRTGDSYNNGQDAKLD